uniref:CUB domain-containing protein n=1 Tax=Branchiostoma floridae TaxID=7739 RepID=C3ZRF0_BRAFL|eukprot:XP_002588878.1 hypothetical protein BRAFLDRAFT_98819 [Branchiostoma floridae]
MLRFLFLMFVAFIERTTFSTGLPSYNLDIFVCRTDAILSVEAPAGHVMFDYSARHDCSLQIQAPRGNHGSKFILNFESLQVGTRDRDMGCGDEELRVYNGPAAGGGPYLSDVYGDNKCNCPDGSDEADTAICGMSQTALPRETSSGWTQYLHVLNSTTISSDVDFLGDETIPAVQDDTADAKKSSEVDQHRNETSGVKKEDPTVESPPAPEPTVSHIAAGLGGCLAAGCVAAVALILDVDFLGDETIPAVQDDTADAKKSSEVDQHRNETSGVKKEDPTVESPPAPEPTVSHIAAGLGGCLAAGCVAAVALILGWLKFKLKSQIRVGSSV